LPQQSGADQQEEAVFKASESCDDSSKVVAFAVLVDIIAVIVIVIIFKPTWNTAICCALLMDA
jgi:hypothetical protein